MYSPHTARFRPATVALVLKSLVLFLVVQLMQIKYSESLTATQASRQVAPSDPQQPSQLLVDPIVLDTDSLYRTSSLRRHKRASASVAPTSATGTSHLKPVDACQSRMEVLTPYYATNSKGKLRTVVNSELMQQAIQVETCVRSTQQASGRCNAQPDCGCEQKYKWHRLLVLDPADSERRDGASKVSSGAGSQGLFMDWFLFPSNCVCRCKPEASARQHFLRTIANSKPTLTKPSTVSSFSN